MFESILLNLQHNNKREIIKALFIFIFTIHVKEKQPLYLCSVFLFWLFLLRKQG